MIIIAISFWTIFSQGESTPICQGLCGGGAAGGRGSTSSGSNHTSPRMHSSRGTGVPSSCSLATEANCEPALSSNPPVSWWCSEKIAQIDPRSSQPSKPVGFRHVSPPGRDLSLSLWWAGIGARAGILRVAAAQLKFMACGAMGRFRRNPNGATQPWWVCHVSDNLGNFFWRFCHFAKIWIQRIQETQRKWGETDPYLQAIYLFCWSYLHISQAVIDLSILGASLLLLK